MTEAAQGRKLVLDRQHLVGMLLDDDFYYQCPYFLWLRNTAKRVYDQNTRAARGCGSCGHDFRAMKPIIDAFFTNLKELKELDPGTVECVRRYLERKKGYKISLVVIMYRSSRSEAHPQKLEFRF